MRVGLVGAGPWAGVSRPDAGSGPETTLAVVYARRIEAARELASGTAPRHRRFDDFSVGVTRCVRRTAGRCRPGWSRSLAAAAGPAARNRWR